jgi:hypothetical protein
MQRILTVGYFPLAQLQGLSCFVRVTDMSSDLIQFLAASAEELILQAGGLHADNCAGKLAEASEMLSLAACLVRRSGHETEMLLEAA